MACRIWLTGWEENQSPSSLASPATQLPAVLPTAPQPHLTPCSPLRTMLCHRRGPETLKMVLESIQASGPTLGCISGCPGELVKPMNAWASPQKFSPQSLMMTQALVSFLTSSQVTC